MGYLNPTELDKDIIQACDPDKIIFTSTNFDDLENIENYINFDTKYYYIVTKELANELSLLLENFNVIEDFEILTENAIERISTIYQEYSESSDYDRGIFSKMWSGIKNAAKTVSNAVSTVAKSVSDFVTKKYTISGTVKYTYNNITMPAYGIKVTNTSLNVRNCETNSAGNFNLGERTDSMGLCYLWLNYENNACRLSNFLGVNASTLVKTALPSYLQNITITSNSDYANAKMAICCDMYSRYIDESKRHSNIPTAIVWTTELGKGTSSAPSFYLRNCIVLPDIILTGVTAKADALSLTRLRVLHHEYTHFLHCVYTENKNNFWDNVVLSEMGCTIANVSVDFINKLFNTDYSTGYETFYNFENPYVYFAENYAEWYSSVGCYSKGVIGKIKDSDYGDGLQSSSYSNFYNQTIFVKIVRLLNYVDSIKNADTENNKKDSTTNADNIVNIVDKYDVTTFNEFYCALVEEYPNLKDEINQTFQTSYRTKGSNDGNVIVYQ